MREPLMDTLLDMEAPVDPLVCANCNSAPVEYRCLDCHGLPQLCCMCLHTLHALCPLHKIEDWTGRFFKKSSLSQSGLIVHTGHHGLRCPSIGSPNTEQEKPDGSLYHSSAQNSHGPGATRTRIPTSLTVVDISGIFVMNTLYCECKSGKAAWQQLVQLGYFPASLSQPATVFTFRVLDYFTLDLVEADTSAMAFIAKVRKCTQTVFSQDVKVRSLQLN